MSGGWKAGAFTVQTDGGPIAVAGWQKGHFALDFRVWDEPYGGGAGGWSLTHLPTGRQAFGVLAPLSTAKDVADKFATLGDWDFSDAGALNPSLKEAATKFVHDNARSVTRKTPFRGPLTQVVA